MPITDLFSNRNRKTPDIFIYNDLPKEFKVQVVHIIHDAFGSARRIGNGVTYYTTIKDAFKYIHDALCREYGVFNLTNDDTFQRQVLNYFLDEQDIEHCLDVIQLCFKFIDKIIRKDYSYYQKVEVKINPDDAIDELNERFKLAGLGYCYEGGQIIRIDSTVAHNEITLPTINLLSTAIFENANEEYLKALGHYRHGRNKECLNEALKAFESVMKIICTKKGWKYDPTGGAKKLIQVCFDNKLIPDYLQTQFTSLKTVIESGIPYIRNNVGGHGQGHQSIIADNELTRYALNLTGANIIFLIEQSGIK